MAYSQDGEWIPHPTWNGDLEAGYDIGLVRLVEPVDQVDPMVLNDQIPDKAWIGQEVTFVGFGLTDPNGDATGVKFMTSMPLTGIGDQYLEVSTTTPAPARATPAGRAS